MGRSVRAVRSILQDETIITFRAFHAWCKSKKPAGDCCWLLWEAYTLWIHIKETSVAVWHIITQGLAKSATIAALWILYCCICTSLYDNKMSSNCV